jgi:hypothetical protein
MADPRLRIEVAKFESVTSDTGNATATAKVFALSDATLLVFEPDNRALSNAGADASTQMKEHAHATTPHGTAMAIVDETGVARAAVVFSPGSTAPFEVYATSTATAHGDAQASSSTTIIANITTSLAVLEQDTMTNVSHLYDFWLV